MSHWQLVNTSKWRRCRLLSVGTTLVSVYTILFLHVVLNTTSSGPAARHMTLTWMDNKPVTTFSPNDSNLIDRNDFYYVLQPNRMCSSSSTPHDDSGHFKRGNGLYFIIYVHSAPQHFQERETIRSTWGSLKTIGKWSVRVIFLLGLTTDQLQRRLQSESNHNGDIVQGNFVDSYRNLSYKHVMGYKWILSNCPKVQFIVKADDDAFVDVVQLYNLLRVLYGDESKGLKALTCSVWPAGSSPQRLPHHKWTVSREEYPHNVYPVYCGGLGYVVSPSAAWDILAASLHVPFFWIDDLYVTGLLAEKVPRLRHNALNLRITYDSQALLDWLWQPVSGNGTQPCPYVFGDVSRGRRPSALMEKLWMKTKSVWKNTQVAYRSR